MSQFPIDSTKVQVIVVGDPTPQLRNGAPVVDRTTNQPMWNVDVAVIGEGRPQAMQLGLPENGFPKGLGIGTIILPEHMVVIYWNRDGRSGVMLRAQAAKVQGGQAGLKSAAA